MRGVEHNFDVLHEPRGEPMSNAPDESLLDALLDSWDRNNTILLNLLRAIPKAGLEARAMQGSPSIAELFGHIHYVRLVFVSEDTPEFASDLPGEEWAAEPDTGVAWQSFSTTAPRPCGTR
jgi:uncharacterized damage-inducible protein DinB